MRVLQASAVLPGTLWSLGITLTLFFTTPCVSVLEQPLKQTGKLCFRISKPKRQRQGSGKRLHTPDDSPRLRVCLHQHLPSANTAQDWQQRCFLSQTLLHSHLQEPPPGCSTAWAVGLHSLPHPTHLKCRWAESCERHGLTSAVRMFKANVSQSNCMCYKDRATDRHPEHATRRSASLTIQLEMQSLQV